MDALITWIPADEEPLCGNAAVYAIIIIIIFIFIIIIIVIIIITTTLLTSLCIDGFHQEVMWPQNTLNSRYTFLTPEMDTPRSL